jgi:putative FmdB family regulatory protein
MGNESRSFAPLRMTTEEESSSAMPLYEYVCQDCNRTTEVLQRLRERPLKICPHCGGKKLKKAFSAPAIQFKGSGFYTTDYARGTNAGKSGTSPKSEPESKSAEAKSSDSKPSEAKASESKTAGSTKSETKSDSKKESRKNP